MKRAKYVKVSTSQPGLEQLEDGCFKMKEVEGEIVFCESRPFSWGGSLVIKLNTIQEDIYWDSEPKMPLPALVGQTLRGFYQNVNSGRIDIKAYELSDGEGVFRRGTESKKYIFVED